MDKHDHTRYIFAKAIKELIKTRPLDKITVIDIVTNAGKTRQTFYRYFKDNICVCVSVCLCVCLSVCVCV